MARNSDGLSMLHRALQILEVFDATTPLLNLSQISARSGLSMTTTHRLTKLLVEENLLAPHQSGLYSLGLRLWEIAAQAPSAQVMREIALPFLQDIQARVQQHTQIGVLIDDEVIFLERLSAVDSVVNFTMVGGRLPVNASSSGIMLLAFQPQHIQEETLERLRTKLTAYTDKTPTDVEELRKIMNKIVQEQFIVTPGWIHHDATGIAVPVRDQTGKVAASLSLVVPNDGRATLPLVRLLQANATKLSEALKQQDNYVMDKKMIEMMSKQVTVVE